MLNHFRTLLLNEPYVQDGEDIPFGYTPKKLPNDLQQIYNILFPPNCSKHYKTFLVQNYLNILSGTGNLPAVLSFDKRITYDLLNPDFFQVSRFSNVVTNDSTYTLEITNGFNTNKFNDYFYDSFEVNQVSDTTISIFSNIKLKYLKGSSEFNSSVPDAWITLVRDTSMQDQNYYKEVSIGLTGAKFRIIEPTPDAMLSDTDLQWKFIIEAPYIFDTVDIYKNIEQINPFATLNKYDTVLIEPYSQAWDSNQNTIYKLAAAIIALVTIINTL